MNLEAIQKAFDFSLPNEIIEQRIIEIIAKDENAIPDVLKILNAERLYKSKAISEMNILLGKAKAALENPILNTEGFMQKEIDNFYKSHPDIINPFQK